MKSGFVAIVGRPNVGKSTLLNSLLERKIAITSDVAGTTRDVILGIYNDEDSQIVFVDTPGIHKARNKLGNHLNKKAFHSQSDTDIILFVIDAKAGFGRGDKFILEAIKNSTKPIFLILNKVDLVPKDELLAMIDNLSKEHDFAEIFPLSSLKNINIDELITSLKNYLPNEEQLYDKEMITNISLNFAIAEIVREKLLHSTFEEVPHSITCLVESLEEYEDYFDIKVLIVVDRDNLKKIIIGRKGSMLKKIGTLARKEIEEFLGKKVYLETYVKTMDNWRDKERLIRELGLNEE